MVSRAKRGRAPIVEHLMRAWLGIVFVLSAVGCDRPSQRTKLSDRSPETVSVSRLAAQSGASPIERPRRSDSPVVVELFSSEGCSSCPPADGVLSELSAKQGIAGANVIALELHVDYWNDLGWADPFSDAAFSARQRAYARAASRRGAFTPEAVVDGRSSVVGSDASALSSEIERAASRPHVGLRLSTRDDGALEAAPTPVPRAPSSYWLAITEAGLVSEVKAGENRGQTLRHAPVVRSLTRVGTVTREATRIALPTVRSATGELTAVVFIQQDDDLAIVGANTLSLVRAAGG